MDTHLRELTLEECIEIRKTLLHEFHRYCEEHKIRYSLGYGTLLGAVRHNGMIPWDDDIDVLVPRIDFERLNELNNRSDCKDRYQFISHKKVYHLERRMSRNRRLFFLISRARKRKGGGYVYRRRPRLQ